MNIFLAPFKLFARNRDLLGMLSKRAIQARFRGSWLGGTWVALHPLLLLSVYTFVFSTLYAGRFHVVPEESATQYALGIFFGINVLSLFNDALAGSVGLITGNRNFVKKVVFPLEMLPVSQILANLFSFGVSMSLALLGVLILGGGFAITVLWLPVVLAPMVMFCMGVSWFISALGVYYRDIDNIVQIIALCMLWMSGVFFSARSLPDSAWMFLRFNPVLLTIELVRDVVLWHLAPNAQWLSYCYGIGAVVFFCGFWFFHLVRRTFADVI